MFGACTASVSLTVCVCQRVTAYAPTADLLLKRYKRAVFQSARASEHLAEMEENLPKEDMRQWSKEIKKWEENVLHLADSDDFATPYELNPEKRKSSSACCSGECVR